MDLDNSYEAIVYLLIGGMIGHSHRYEFNMVSVLVCMIKYGIRPDYYSKIWSNQCEYREIIESGWVPGKGRIHASIEKLSWRVPEKGRMSVSTEK